MSEQLKAVSSKPSVNFVILEGKINDSQTHKQKYYTELILPAADEYSHPSTVKVVSTRQLGSVGQPVTVECTPRGFVRTFPITKGARAGQQGREVHCWFVPLGDIG